MKLPAPSPSQRIGKLAEIDYESLGSSPCVLSVLATNSNTLFVRFCSMKLSRPLMVLCLGDHGFYHQQIDAAVEHPMVWLMKTRQSGRSDRPDNHSASWKRWECDRSEWARHGVSSLDTMHWERTIIQALWVRGEFLVLLITPFSFPVPCFSSPLVW